MNRLFPGLIFLLSFMSCIRHDQPDYQAFGPLLQKSFIWNREPDSLLEKPHSVGFRKEIEIKRLPEEAKIMIFADSRYLLWINGKYVERGPCRFDPKGPQYDLVDIQAYLHIGKNYIVVLVHGGVRNVIGNLKIMKHMPGLAAIIVADKQQFVTDTTWLCSDKIPEQMWNEVWTWSCILDKVDNNTPDFNWQMPGFDDREWGHALQISGAAWGRLKQR
jgi:alpha-L-rhamnosidase